MQSPFDLWSSINSAGFNQCGTVWYWLASSSGSKRRASPWQQRVQSLQGTIRSRLTLCFPLGRSVRSSIGVELAHALGCALGVGFGELRIGVELAHALC